MLSTNDLIMYALQEDIGPGDITTDSIIEKNITGKGIILAKENIVIAGLNIAHKVFSTVDSTISFKSKYLDGNEIASGEIVAEIDGTLSSLLKAERTALNFLQRLSGIATKTRKYVNEVSNTKVKLVDTRKTTPCWRILEKYAVRLGGGHNHRIGLYDGVIIKDNHIAACGSILDAVNKTRNSISHLIKIEVEVSSLIEVKDAIDANVDVIMLDNMQIDQIKRAVKMINGKASIEISGGITFEKLSELASTGIDIISVGALTHSAVAVDLSMKIDNKN